MRHVILILVAVFAGALSLGAAAQAQADLGNDGVDRDCIDFGERLAAEFYFEGDGGSADRNVDGLDNDGNGIPCDVGDEDRDEVDTLPTTGVGAALGRRTGSSMTILAGTAAALTVVGLRLRKHA